MKSKAIEQYRKSESIGKPDGKALLLCYERILEASANHDGVAVERGLTLLEESLNFDPNPQLGFQLLKLYQYLRHCLKQEQFGEICRVIETLRNIWESAIEADRLNLDSVLDEHGADKRNPDSDPDRNK